MAPLLSTSAVEANFNGMRDSVAKLVTKWASSPTPVDVTDDLRRMNIQSTTLCFFNQDINCLEGPEPPIILAMERATGEAVKRPTRPKLLNALLYQRMFDKDTKTMREFASKIVAERETQSTATHEDMLQALLHGKDPETGTTLNSEQVIDEVVTIYIGTTTTPNFVAFATFYLMQNPECVTKAREEIDTVVGRHNPLTLQRLAQLPYCEAVCREAIRLSAPAPGFNIEPIPGTTGPVSLAGGKYQVPGDQCMITILAAVNRDPTVFEEPEAFKPERMLPEAFEKLPPGTKKWFGNGKRECIGNHYAWQWSLVTLVEIVRNLDLELADPSYTLKMDGAFSVKPLNLMAKIRSRS
jgi:cytochrome P450